jgi:hypothetical protein
MVFTENAANSSLQDGSRERLAGRTSIVTPVRAAFMILV